MIAGADFFSNSDLETNFMQAHDGKVVPVEEGQFGQKVKKMDEFVEKATNNMIKEIVKESSVNALTQFVMIQAMCFKIDWVKKFTEKGTDRGEKYVLTEFKWKGDNAEGAKPIIAKEKYYYCGSSYPKCGGDLKDSSQIPS